MSSKTEGHGDNKEYYNKKDGREKLGGGGEINKGEEGEEGG